MSQCNLSNQINRGFSFGCFEYSRYYFLSKMLFMSQRCFRVNNYILFHVHPISLFVVDELIKMNHIAVIEINREPQGPAVEELLLTFKKIQDNNKSLIISLTQISVNYELFEKEIEIIFRNLSYKGLCLYINADSVEDGIRRIDIVRKALEKKRR